MIFDYKTQNTLNLCLMDLESRKLCLLFLKTKQNKKPILFLAFLLGCALSACEGARAPDLGGVYGSHTAGLPAKLPVNPKVLKQEVCNTEACQEAGL